MPDFGVLKTVPTKSGKETRRAKRRGFNPPLRQKLGRRIRLRRVARGLTQRELAKLVGLSSQRQGWGIEHGLTGMTVETAGRLAQALGWSLSRLFDGL